MIMKGNPRYQKCEDENGCEQRWVSPLEKHALRCCSDTYIDGYAQEKRRGDKCTVWHESYFGRSSGGEGHEVCEKGAVTYWDGKAFCESKGARLCTKKEIQNLCVRQSGCGIDAQMTWTDKTR